MGKREWIDVDSGDLDVTPYLIKVDRDGSLHGYCYADMSGVIDAFGDQAYAEFIDEDSDTLTVYRLTEFGPIPCRVSTFRHDGAGMVQVVLGWSIPGVRGKAGRPSESGYYPIKGW